VHWQVEGADFRFQERMRGVVEYMQYREMPADLKRKVRAGLAKTALPKMLGGVRFCFFIGNVAK
jgi:hypothetical protein